jgi:hypothetical protein
MINKFLTRNKMNITIIFQIYEMHLKALKTKKIINKLVFKREKI